MVAAPHLPTRKMYKYDSPEVQSLFDRHKEWSKANRRLRHLEQYPDQAQPGEVEELEEAFLGRREISWASPR